MAGNRESYVAQGVHRLRAMKTLFLVGIVVLSAGCGGSTSSLSSDAGTAKQGQEDAGHPLPPTMDDRTTGQGAASEAGLEAGMVGQTDSGGDASDGADCHYPPVQNDPRCPVDHHSQCGKACTARPDVACAYPGQGDLQANGCWATAMAWCKAPPGSDGGTTSWTCAQ